jgi:DNA polymerase-1
MPIQGSAADIIKRAMLAIHQSIHSDPRIKMILQVHDELVFEVKKDFAEEATAMVVTAMEQALPTEYREIVALLVDTGIGKNWYEAH